MSGKEWRIMKTQTKGRRHNINPFRSSNGNISMLLSNKVGARSDIRQCRTENMAPASVCIIATNGYAAN